MIPCSSDTFLRLGWPFGCSGAELLHWFLMKIFLHCSVWFFLVFSTQPFAAVAEVIHVGMGSYTTDFPPSAQLPPSHILRTTNVLGPMPSNDWWSSLAWVGGTFVQYPHPLAVKVEPAGLRLYYPGFSLHANKTAIFGSIPETKVDFVLGHSAVTNFSRPLVDGYSDWFVDLQFATNQHRLRLSFGHGSPFVYAVYENGHPRLTFAEIPNLWTPNKGESSLGVTIQGRHYGLFAPSGSSWSGSGSTVLTCDTHGKDFFSAAILPDNTPATFALFKRYAHAHVTGSKVDWKYEPATATVTTHFNIKTVPREGNERGTLFALYPHHWRHSPSPLLPLQYNSVRGTMKLSAGTSFMTQSFFPGILPALPDAGGTDAASITDSLRRDLSRVEGDPKDTYWANKKLARLSTLIPISEIYGLPETEVLRQSVQTTVEQWLSAVGTNGLPKTSGMFCYNTNWGSLIGYPSSYGSDKELNDHHFHYGYLIKAAAEIARHDPAWGRSDRWGGMIERIIRDFASADRNDPLFPLLRNFDIFAGHTWASGHAQFGDGNNNESSSESMNAWSGLILWAEATGNKSLRDLGVWLYTTEMHAIQEYWFDVTGENHPATYTPSVMTMIWGGKSANETWFTADPQLVHGINWLPIHGGSLYLGHFPAYAAKNYQALVSEFGSDRWNNWPDIIWMYRVFSDADDAIRLFSQAPSTLKLEDGNSWTNARHWIYNLKKLGLPNPAITASQPLATVFRNGSTNTYVVYSSTPTPSTVRFSDGQKVSVNSKGYTLQRSAR